MAQAKARRLLQISKWLKARPESEFARLLQISANAANEAELELLEPLI